MRRAAASIFLFISACGPLFAQDDQRYVAALRSLSVNRSLLARYEAEYRALASGSPSETDAEALSDLRYKIQALNEDAERLRASLPAGKDPDPLLQKALHEKSGTRPVDVDKERRIEQTARKLHALHEKALALAGEGRYEQAARVYEDIVLTNPDDDEAYVLLGHVSLAAADYDRAAGAFHNAIHIDPANMREIPRLYENILVESPSDDEVLMRLGYAHLLLGGTGPARQAFEDALSVNPDNIEARRGLMELPAA